MRNDRRAALASHMLDIDEGLRFEVEAHRDSMNDPTMAEWLERFAAGERPRPIRRRNSSARRDAREAARYARLRDVEELVGATGGTRRPAGGSVAHHRPAWRDGRHRNAKPLAHAYGPAAARRYPLGRPATAGRLSARRLLAARGDPRGDKRADDHLRHPGQRHHTIQPTETLPTLGNSINGVTIDGYTQPGAHPNTADAFQAGNAAIKIVLDGSL